MFKAYKILMIHKYKDMWKNKFEFLYELLTPFSYGMVFLLQAIFIYRSHPQAFQDLNTNEYILGIALTQGVYMFGNYSGMGNLANSVLDTQFDFVLLRPIKLFFYKYIIAWNPVEIFLCFFYVIISIIFGILSQVSLLIAVKLVLFLIIAALIRLNFFGFLLSWVFYLRNWDHVYRVDTIMTAAQNTPQEVFTKGFKFTLTYLLPAIVTLSFVFEIIRNRDGAFLWIILITWMVVSMILNKLIWILGVKKYESVS